MVTPHHQEWIYEGESDKDVSPLLFNLYADRIFKEAISDLDLSIRVNGVHINTLKYADDTDNFILSENIEDLQLLLDRISAASHGARLNINIDEDDGLQPLEP